MRSRSALLWLTHVWDLELRAEFEKFLRMNPDSAPDVWLLLDSRTRSAADLAEQYPQCHLFDEESVFRLPYPRLPGRGLMDHIHFPVLDFYLSHRGYEAYWIVEYDVRYTGEWESFLHSFGSLDHDLITSHIRRFAQEPRWPWWGSLHHPTQIVPQDQYVRSFNVIYRVSNRALEFLHQAQLDGWRGHPEVSFPTLLSNNGFSLLDFGGSGEFSPPQNKNRVYTSRGSASGYLSMFGTLRFRPARSKPGGNPDMLYHPVKPKSMLEPRTAIPGIAARMAWEFTRDLGWR